MRTFLEPFVGSGALFLYLLGAPPPYGLAGYSGNKRRVAPYFARLLWPYPEPPDRVVLADIGPWRWVWEAYAAGKGQEIIEAMARWPDMPDRELWNYLVSLEPVDDPIEMAARYLPIQARQAHHAPVWLAESWTMASGTCGTLSKPYHSHPNAWQRDAGSGPTHQDGRTWVRADRSGKGESAPSHKTGEPRVKSWRSGNPLSLATLKRRIEALLSLPWSRVQVYEDYREATLEAQAGDVVYFDPPYHDAKVRYQQGWPADLEEYAHRVAQRGAQVAVSDSRPFSTPGKCWHAQDVTGLFGSQRKPGSEWLTTTWEHSLTVPQLTGGIQQEMFG